jgi:hypothetical protein
VNDDGFKHAAATAVLFCGNLAQKKEESLIVARKEIDLSGARGPNRR